MANASGMAAVGEAGVSSLALYLGSVENGPLLTREEEIRLSRRARATGATRLLDALEDGRVWGTSPEASPEDEVLLGADLAALAAAIRGLPEREAWVLRRRYGLGGAGARSGATLARIADEEGCSRECVRRLLRSAEESLRLALASAKAETAALEPGRGPGPRCRRESGSGQPG